MQHLGTPEFERLPRGRGDGPLMATLDGLVYAAPPRSRGWTRRRLVSRNLARGSPAVAGMDRSPSLCSSTSMRLPRGRGDGPQRVTTYLPSRPAPPRSRGWTRDVQLRIAVARGSPAVAGMDRARWPRRWRNARLPRGRGDGPTQGGGISEVVGAPPRSRGWTAARRATAEGVMGSPAVAGMDPLPTTAHADAMRLPRGRGDGPADAVFLRRLGEAPPRSRGWTRDI